jgi:hypothetical protein
LTLAKRYARLSGDVICRGAIKKDGVARNEEGSMKLEWFDAIRATAREQIRITSSLNYGQRRDLLDLQHAVKKVNEREAAAFRLQMESICAESVADFWFKSAGNSVRDLPIKLFRVSNSFIGRAKNDRGVLKGLAVEVLRLRESDAPSKFASHATQSDKERGIHALGAIERSIAATECGDLDLDRNLPDDTLPDGDSALAASWACACLGGGIQSGPSNDDERKASQKFWIWYVDEAFPKAVLAVNKTVGAQ